MRFFVSGVRLTLHETRYIQIMDKHECIALVPYSDRNPHIHQQCYDDAKMIVEALNKASDEVTN